MVAVGRVAPLLVKTLGVLGVAAAAFVGGHELAGGDEEGASTSFHDMRVVTAPSLQVLIDGDDPAVVSLARRLGTPEAAYLFVRDQIGFEPSRPARTAAETLRDRAASCLGKAALLASLYRAQGMDDGQVRVVTGQVGYGCEFVDHAWVEMEYKGNCLQQDPTTLLGLFAFDEFKGTAYTRAHVVRELFCFNDRGFAVVSQLNRFRGGDTAGVHGR